MQGTPIPQLLGDQWSGEKVLVTGASRFKGSWLFDAPRSAHGRDSWFNKSTIPST